MVVEAFREVVVVVVQGVVVNPAVDHVAGEPVTLGLDIRRCRGSIRNIFSSKGKTYKQIILSPIYGIRPSPIEPCISEH